jgi:hypothetical protein
MTVKLEICTDCTAKAAAQFVAQLVREGVCFTATQRGDFLEIFFTGGY